MRPAAHFTFHTILAACLAALAASSAAAAPRQQGGKQELHYTAGCPAEEIAFNYGKIFWK